MKNLRFLLPVAFILYFLIFLVRFDVPFPYVWFVLGGSLSVVFLLIDRVVQVWWDKQYVTQKMALRQLMTERKYTDVVRAFFELKRVAFLSDSFYFLLVYWPLAIFVMSSSGSELGVGLVSVLGLRYVFNFLVDWNNISQLRVQHFEKMEHWPDQTIRGFCAIFIALFFVLTLASLIR